MGRGEDDPPKVEKEGIKMKTMARKRLSGLIRLSLAFIVALTLAAPYTSAAAYANELITNTLRNTDIDLVAYSSDAKASLSLDEAKAALDSANQNKADAAASKDEAQKALDEATAQYNEAESAHSDAAQAANAAKAEADKAVGDAISAKEAEVAAAEARYQETYDALVAAQKNEKEARDNLKKAQTDYQAARGEFDSAVKDMNNYNLSQSVSDLTQAEKEYNAAALKHSELMDAYQAATKEREKAYAAYQSASSKVDSADKAVTSADSKVTQAKEALAAAQARLDAAEEADGVERERLQGLVNEARTNLSAAQSQRSTAQGNLESARSAQASAQTVYDNAVAALEAAKKAAEGAGADLDALKQAADDAKEKSDQAESDYNNAASNLGNPGSYADAEAALAEAQRLLDEAEAAVTTAETNYNNAKAELDAINQGQGEDTGQMIAPENPESEASSGDDSSGASDPSISTSVTQDEVDDFYRIWQEAITTRDGLKTERDNAKTKFDNASSIKSLEDAKTAAAAEYQRAKAAYEAAANGSSSVDLSSYEQAVRDAEADLNAASGEVTSLENQIAAMDRNISSLETAAQQAQENLDNYGGSDHSVLEQAVADCNAEWVDAQAELDKANADLTAAQSEKTQADTIYRAKNDAVEAALREEKTFREGELARANEAKKNATTAYTNAVNGITDDSLKDTPYEGTPAAQVVRNIKALKNKADALDKEVIRYQAAIPGLGVKIEEANTIFGEAGTQLRYAEAGLERAKALDIEDIINNPKEEGTEFFALNEFANKLAAAREQEKPFAENHEAARVNLENARNSFATASAELDRTTAEAAAAQKVYDDLLAQQDNNNGNNGGSKDPDVYTPGKKPATKPAASNGKATVRTADDKTSAKDEVVAEQSDEQTTEEAVVTVSQEQRTPVQPKAWTFFGIDPLIVGIVGAAILVAAAAAIAAAVIRHRRIAAEVVESDE